MKKLLAAADRYVETSDWKTIAVLKFCLLSIGVLFGMQVKPEHRRFAAIGAFSVFLVTYIPLMQKLLRLLFDPE